MKVKAYAAKGPKQRLEPFEYEAGALGPDEVDVKVTHCGICHSDVAIIDNDFGITAYPVVPGHEVVGTVAAVGRAVTDLKPGQRVGVGWQCGSCRHCEWCKKGLECFCANERDTIVHHHGGWAEVVRVQDAFAIPIPDALDSRIAGPLFCAGTTVFTPIVRYGVTPLMRTAVVGVGGLGHLAVQFLAAFGCEVTAISTSHAKDDEARKLGATHFIATKDTQELEKAAESFDFILCTASSSLDWSKYIKTLRPMGKFVLVGIPESDIKLSAFDLIGKERQFAGGRSGSPSDTAKMLDFSARHGVAPWVEEFAMKEVNQALDHVRAGKARYRVVLAA
jgi:uncharacterized zinc-type alcohol dehydrogenase-like protein